MTCSLSLTEETFDKETMKLLQIAIFKLSTKEGIDKMTIHLWVKAQAAYPNAREL